MEFVCLITIILAPDDFNAGLIHSAEQATEVIPRLDGTQQRRQQ